MEIIRNISLTESHFADAVATLLGYEFLIRDSWPAEVRELQLPEAELIGLSERRANGSLVHVFQMEGGIAEITLEEGKCDVSVYGASMAVARRTLDQIKAIVPVQEPPEGQIRFTFWNLGAHGGTSRNRTIEVASWKDIRRNYSTSVQQRLDPFMDPNYRPSSGGKLILWRGQPGTGKTWAIRALANEWRSWAKFQYVVDPDNFFGASPEYMMNVILGEKYGLDEETPGWRVLILEDAGELLAADAKMNTGQGLSRLLNVVDGLVGQGLKLLVLVTTNEDLGKLHPAVSRSGRALMNVEFTTLSPAEADEWAHAHGVEHAPSGRLSDLYEAQRGGEVPATVSLGFNSGLT